MTKSKAAKKPKAKMGRPPVEHPRKLISLRVTDDEHNRLKAAAQASGIGDLSKWLRFICLREANQQLGRR